MPNLEQELTKTGGSMFYATFDLSHGYWQLPLDVLLQACLSLITPDGIYFSTIVLHGTTSAVMYLQSSLSSNVPAELRRHVL